MGRSGLSRGKAIRRLHPQEPKGRLPLQRERKPGGKVQGGGPSAIRWVCLHNPETGISTIFSRFIPKSARRSRSRTRRVCRPGSTSTVPTVKSAG